MTDEGGARPPLRRPGGSRAGRRCRSGARPRASCCSTCAPRRSTGRICSSAQARTRAVHGRRSSPDRSRRRRRRARRGRHRAGAGRARRRDHRPRSPRRARRRSRRACFPLPASLSFEEGAALLVSLLTAGWALARWDARAGDETAIHSPPAAGSAPRRFRSPQLGLTVVATARPKTGAPAPPRWAPTWCAATRTSTRRAPRDRRRGADIVLDGVGGDVTRRSLRCSGHWAAGAGRRTRAARRRGSTRSRWIHSSDGRHRLSPARAVAAARGGARGGDRVADLGRVGRCAAPIDTVLSTSTRCASPMSGSPVAAPSGRSSSRPDAGIGAHGAAGGRALRWRLF